jgi:hypothetical protein
MDAVEMTLYHEDDEDDDFGTVNAFTPMRFDTMRRKLRDLLSEYANKDLDPRPSFQRGYVWDKTRASRLVESILLNVPLSLIYTAEEIHKAEVVIDGKFPKDSSKFRLQGLELSKNLNGKYYIDLDDTDKKAIQNRIFQIIKISNESHADVKFEIFECLNSRSVTLKPQELRNCVCRGNFNDVLCEMASKEDFRKVLEGSSITGHPNCIEPASCWQIMLAAALTTDQSMQRQGLQCVFETRP